MVAMTSFHVEKCCHPPGLYLASVTQRLRLQLYDLNYGAIQIILLTYLFTYLLTWWVYTQHLPGSYGSSYL